MTADPRLPVAPEQSEGAFGPLMRAVRAHRLLVVLVTLAALVGSIAWLLLRTPEYEAKASMLVTPLAQDDQTFVGIQLLRADTNESTRTLQTAATLVDSPRAQQLAAVRVGHGWTSRRVAESTDVEPEGQSNILAITARAGEPKLAARLANEFAGAALAARRELLRRQVAATLRGLERRQGAVSGNQQAAADLADRLSQLNAVRDGHDPTLSLSQAASVPASPAGAPAWLIVAMAWLAGLTLGVGAALLLELLDRRVRDEEELGSVFPLPVLAHVPKLSRRELRRQQSALAAPPAVREAFRTLQVQLDRGGGLPRVVMFTSASTGDGKTTSAVSLATALVGAGHRVMLIDLDLRKPDVGERLGAQPKGGLVSLLVSGNSRLADLVVPAPELPPLKVVPGKLDGEAVLIEALGKRLGAILQEARSMADYVVLDTPPLGEVSDALRLIDEVDDVVLVARPGNTNRPALELMRDLIGRTGVTPTGFLVIGAVRGRPSSYYAYGLETRRQLVDPSPVGRSGN